MLNEDVNSSFLRRDRTTRAIPAGRSRCIETNDATIIGSSGFHAGSVKKSRPRTSPFRSFIRSARSLVWLERECDTLIRATRTGHRKSEIPHTYFTYMLIAELRIDRHRDRRARVDLRRNVRRTICRGIWRGLPSITRATTEMSVVKHDAFTSRNKSARKYKMRTSVR